jgi:FMN phosphatase YigB (HAD superfamily)
MVGDRANRDGGALGVGMTTVFSPAFRISHRAAFETSSVQ